MTKTVTVHAQQRWEYRSVTKHTEATLLAELNEVGKAGWELVSASYNRDLKGVWAWTAILKRPLAHPVSHDAPAAEAAAPKPAADKGPEVFKGFDLSGETFDLQAPEPRPKPADLDPEPGKIP